MIPAIRVENLTKNYGKVQALSGLDINILQGEAFCLLGPNGAGKSTAINLMLGLGKADSGNIQVFGQPPQSKAARQMLGYAAQDTDFPPFLKVREIIALVRCHFENPLSEAELLDGFGLAKLADRYTGGFSGGERRRLSLALAFAGRSKIVFLDEPTVGLDVKSRCNFWDYTNNFVKQGGTVVVTTHHIDEIETLSDRICIINNGKNRLSGTVREIRDSLGQKRVLLKCVNLPDLPGILDCENDNGDISINTSDADALVRALVNSGAVFSDLEIRSATLEEALNAQSLEDK